MHQTRIRLATIAALAAASIVASTAASAQSRLSLADRVARLEAQSQGAGQGQAQSQIELLNRIEQLQSEVQGLRNTVEQQQFEIEGLKRSARERQIELDSRISRLEGGNAAAPPAGGAQFSAPTPIPAPSTAPGGLVAEPVFENMPTPEPAPAGAAFDEIPAPAPAAAPAGDEKSMYDEAFGALRDGRYAESARLFRAFLDAHPNGELAPNALYWLGESYYVTQNFQIALDTFDELLQRFPQSPKAQDALLKVGYCHYELKQWPEAERALNEVVRRYPDTTVARLAQGRLRALRLDAQRR
jgi:tol-pal system protein YbgF